MPGRLVTAVVAALIISGAAVALRDGRLATYTPRTVGVRDDEAVQAERRKAVEAAASKAAQRSNGSAS